ncbi:hypothetical protein EJ05DRAFT_490630 [Pseudovirgaria hyperparasitica]|uniref:Uncharacterized protein n=1 Tax=Pseudovirgaria hyperparasitica TaxID=470096 RepID=A0A6A6VQ86_9PEZI|nr:uncharacterized protein EJ05DRAFT_490630 [Pseudovirgaria hyperparasitica]KAF2752808.1 hypothetical protein EJ05DRAFT_490630 [Pseudovirgaria hyperparasitica]
MHSRRNHNNLSLPTDQLRPTAVTSSFLSPKTPFSQHRVFLLERSPPPSPGLPVPDRELAGKAATGSRGRLFRRLLLIVLGTLSLALWGTNLLYSYNRSENESPLHGKGRQYDMVEASELPDEPCAIIVKDHNRRTKWTVYIPSTLGFPLKPSQYAEICLQSVEMSHHVAEQTKSHSKRHQGYYQQDPHFVDVLEAWQQGLLPSEQDEHTRPNDGTDVCKKSLTYVLETSDAGMGNALLGLWMSYGLAQHEGRAFFIDDSRWAYGNYSTYFQSPPKPNCRSPRPSQIVPCPHTARHIVVSAAITKHTFGHAFIDEWEDPRRMNVQRQHKIFALLRTGYDALFKLRYDDATYVEKRVQSLYNPTTTAGGLNIAIHIRRGDRHPFEYQYSKDYLPTARFLDSAVSLVTNYFASGHHFPGTPVDRRDPLAPSAVSPISTDADSIAAIMHNYSSSLVLASDDAALYKSSDLAPPTTTRAQSHIVLATKSELLASATKQGTRPNKFVDDVSGWEGGFYASMFWGLGMPRDKEHARSYSFESPVGEEAMRLRELLARSYLLDLSVLGRADAVICAVGSAACRILGVMVGWEGVGGTEEDVCKKRVY